MPPSAIDSQQHSQLRCMEIWGGNQAMDSALSVPGIDAWVYSQPYAGAESGGDIHYVSVCGGNRLARFVVADVSGHGAAVGGLAARLRALMRKNMHTLDQTRFVRALNEEFTALAEGNMFATALLASYFAPTDYLIMCNAGHPPPLWYRPREQRWVALSYEAAETLDAVTNIPLGIISPTSYHQFAVQLEKGDLVVLYTDWLPESSDPAGRQLGGQGVLELVREIDVNRPQEFTRTLLNRAAEYRGGSPPTDDATVIMLHHNAAEAPRQSISEMITVMGKMFRLVRV